MSSGVSLLTLVHCSLHLAEVSNDCLLFCQSLEDSTVYLALKMKASQL